MTLFVACTTLDMVMPSYGHAISQVNDLARGHAHCNFSKDALKLSFIPIKLQPNQSECNPDHEHDGRGPHQNTFGNTVCHSIGRYESKSLVLHALKQPQAGPGIMPRA
jgi:hypothetical protein